MPALFLLIPLVGVVGANLFNRKTSEKVSFWVALFVGASYIALAATSGNPAWAGFTQAVNRYVPFGKYLEVDFLTAVALATIGLVSLAALIVDKGLKHSRVNKFSNLLLVVMMGMSGIALARDIFSLYVFLEITGVASFVLIAMKKKRSSLEGAFKYLIMSVMATIFILSGIAIVFLTMGGVDYKSVSDWLASRSGTLPPQTTAAFILFICGFSIKAGTVPFHGWLPDAYTSAPTSVSILLGGIVTKITGVYTIMRLVRDVFNNNRIIGTAFMIIGVSSIVIGAVAAFGQKDFRRMLAYSSISQVGYIILAAGLGTPLGFMAALLHFVNHAVFKSLLFVNAAAVERATGTGNMEKMGGLAAYMPVTAGTSVAGFLSVAGIPPLSGFWSKLLIIIALFQANRHVFAAIALLASIITLAYFLAMQRKIFFGKPGGEWARLKEAGALNIAPAIALAGITVALGILFPVILNILHAQGLI